MLSYYCWYVGILLLSTTLSNALLLPSSNNINTASRGGYQQHIISSPIHNKPKNNNRVVALNAYDRFQKDDNTFGNRNRGGSGRETDIDDEAEQLARDLAARRGINVNNNERRGERERLQQDSMGNRNNPNSPFGKDIGGGPPFASGPTNPSFGNNAARMSSGPIPVTQSFGRSPSQSSGDRYDELFEDIVNSEQGRPPQDENLFRKRMNDIPPPSDTPRRLSEQQWLRKENREIPPDAVVRGQKQQRNFVHNDQQQRRMQSASRSGLDIDRSNNPPLPPRGAPPRNIPPVRRSDSANYMNDQRSGMSANYQQQQSYRQPPPPSQTYNSINRERRERLSRQPMPPNGGLTPPPNIRNAYKNMAMPPPPMSPPLSEIASWNYRSQQVNQNNVYNNMPTSSWNSMGGRQWRVPTKGGGPVGGYQQGMMPPYQQGPPMSPYQQGRSMGYSRRSASVPLSQLAIQPHIEPIDRDTKSSQSQTPYGSGTRTSSSMESKPLPFANMDSSEFRQPYSSNRREGKEPNGVGAQGMSQQQQSFDNNFPGQQQSPMMMQPPMMQQPMMQQPPSMQQQQQQQQQPGGRKSFQPPNFRDVPQSDFRQPSQFEEQETFGGKPGPSFPGSPSSEGGPPPNFDQQQSAFEEDMMFGPPFGVPPMMFPPPMGARGPPGVYEKRPSVFSGEDGVKVPKDPILEKQKREQQQKSTGSVQQPLKGKEEIKIPKDPFMERKKKKTESPQKQQVAQKQPKDPFVERQKQQERLLEMGLPPPQPIPIQQQNNPLKGSEEKIPKEPRERRPNEPQQRRPNEPQLGSRNSYAPQRKSSIPEGSANTPRDPRQPPSSNFDRPSFGGKTSFGSGNSGEDDMTYEEYLQYYNLNK